MSFQNILKAGNLENNRMGTGLKWGLIGHGMRDMLGTFPIVKKIGLWQNMAALIRLYLRQVIRDCLQIVQTSVHDLGSGLKVLF